MEKTEYRISGKNQFITTGLGYDTCGDMKKIIATGMKFDLIYIDPYTSMIEKPEYHHSLLDCFEMLPKLLKSWTNERRDKDQSEVIIFISYGDFQKNPKYHEIEEIFERKGFVMADWKGDVGKLIWRLGKKASADEKASLLIEKLMLQGYTKDDIIRLLGKM